MSNVYDVGEVASLAFTLRVDTVLTDATVALTVTAPDGTVLPLTPSHDGVGLYSYELPVTAAGVWSFVWTATGAATAAESGSLIGLSAADMGLFRQVKDRLNKTLTTDDGEVAEMLLAALREYAEYVGPVGEVTETLSGGSDRLILRAPVVTEITAAAYADGTVIDVDDLTVDNGIVYWGYGTAGWFTWGTRNVTITYTVASLPANHREAIIADVAGYFEATQLGPRGPDDDGYANAYNATPTVLFPRIRALAPPRVA